MLNSSSMEVSRSLTSWQKGARSVIHRALQHLDGNLTVIENFPEQTQTSHEQFGRDKPDTIHAVIEVKHPDFYSRVLKGGSIAAAEAYMDGWWESPNLTALMQLMAANLGALDKLESQSNPVTKWLNRVTHWLKRNTIEQAKENIHQHYDLGNELYQLFLDDSMLYSSALFNQADLSLEQAQQQKMQRLCEQLQLKPTDHVLEIGTGWGAMAIYIAQNYGCRVTTTTISEEQFAYAKQKIAALGLSEQITLLKQDYRLLEGQYDKLVSIEMIEAVGKAYLPRFLSHCYALLKPHGKMALQAITIADQRYESYSNNVDFIQKYIFPGGFLPSVSVLTELATKRTGFVVRNLHDIGIDYAITLQHWRERFEQQLPKVRELGYDERFIRMWRYYFCYCEGGFLARSISTVHMTFERD
ncbi:cyclopropane-fatty-acyl-phospholipid synthase family protein [Vibrio mimicus]|nr:cyclopropane-fatty-acyl-phospholipid synthase family protein [Vibrio mimicus]QXC56612.1 cyclopropane-fatty-acyl-phospholipid synthase family protein [Vibrio mimicus]